VCEELSGTQQNLISIDAGYFNYGSIVSSANVVIFDRCKPIPIVNGK